MLQDHLPESVSYGQDRKSRFGLGFEVEVDPKSDNAIPGEHGWNGAASTYYFGDSKKRCTAVFMNALMPFDGALKERFTNLARQVVAEQPHKPIVATRDGLVQGVFEKDCLCPLSLCAYAYSECDDCAKRPRRMLVLGQ